MTIKDDVVASGMRISIKWKIFALVAVLISTALVIVVMRTSQIFREDKEAFVKELTAKLSSSAAKNVANRIATLQDKLIIFISSKESLSHTGAKVEDQIQVLFSRYQDFTSISFLTPDSAGTLKADWVLRNPHGAATAWPTDFEKSFLTTFNTKSAAANGRALWRAKAPDGTWLVVLGFGVQVVDVKKMKARNQAAAAAAVAPPPVGGTGAIATPSDDTLTAWIMGVLPGNALNDLLNDFSTGLNTGFIVNNEGFAIAHSDQTARGANLAKHPIVEDLMQANRPGGAGDYLDLEGRPVIGSFEWIPKINLAVAVTTPRDKAFEAAEVLLQNILFIGIVILLIAIGTAVLLSNYMTGPLQKLAVIAAEIGAGNFKVPINIKTNDEIGELATSFAKMEQGLLERDEALAAAQGALIQSEKMSAFGQLSAGIAHEVKNPLAGILGHAQLAMNKATSDDMKKHLEVIEKETRRCKTIVENLMKFARAEKAQLQPTDLAQVCQDTINLVDHQLGLAGCKIYKDFQPCVMVEANGNQLQQVLLNLMVNAGHAMENCPTKNVTVRVLQVGNKAQIQIDDTGVGIPAEIQKKVFEPFFTTKPAGKGTGLGLSVSIGIIKDHKGDIHFKSVLNKGTVFYIDFPIPEGAKISEVPLENSHGGHAVPGGNHPAPSGHGHSTPVVTPTPPAAPPAPAAVAAVATPSTSTASSTPAAPAAVPESAPTLKAEPPASGTSSNIKIPDLAGSFKAPPKLASASKDKVDDFKVAPPKALPKLSKASAVRDTSGGPAEPERSLGGKAPLKNDIGLPAHPDEAETVIEKQAFNKPVDAKPPTSIVNTQPVVEAQEPSLTSVAPSPSAAPVVDATTPPAQSQPAAGGEIAEFKVKVRRPKLKV